MNYIYWLSQIQYSEQSLVGNKLFILSQLLQNECSILPGFVLGSNLWQRFFADLKQELPAELGSAFTSLDLDNYQILQSIARRSRQRIDRAAFPDTWQAEIFQAAKQFDSEHLVLQPFVVTPNRHHQINSLWRSPTCQATPEALSTAVKSVWSELFTANSLLYWHKSGVGIERIELSILVRPLPTARASGIIEIDRDLVRIKATWGLPLSLFQGDVEPDEYYLDRTSENILTQHLGRKNYAYHPTAKPSNGCLTAYVPAENLSSSYVLDAKAIARLLQLTQEILERQPQIRYLAWTAIDFVSDPVSDPNFYFTQLGDRTITTLSVEKIGDRASPSQQPLLTGMAVSPGRVRAKVTVVNDLEARIHSIPPGSILVTKAIDPRHLSVLKHLGGIITETGGKTSHGAIIARELKIPAIVNVANATELIQNGTEVLLDGEDGRVYAPTADRHLSFSPEESIATTAEPIATKLTINLSQPESIASAIDLPVDGVGLLRSELMLAEFLADQTLAQWQEAFQKQFIATLSDRLRQFTAAFAPRPVFYRSLDRYAKDPSNTTSSSRGTLSYTKDPTLFDLELEALKIITTEGYTNLNLILPFVRSVDEFEFCYRRIENMGLTAQTQVWIMAEVPSVMLLLPEYIRAGVRGIAIGTNDLTQLLLGVDRDRYTKSDLNANHPAMQKAIAQLIKTAKENNIECCICGQAPVEHPDLIDKLIQWGIDIISVEPEAVNRTYKAIARAEKRILLGEVRDS